MKTIIIGASGLVGSNTLIHFLDEGVEAIGTHFSFETNHTEYFDTLTLSNPDNFSIEQFNPNVIIHCGALTHVDYCEENEEESRLKTVQSTANLIKVAYQLKAKFVYISTDYVFDGLSGPYQEQDEVNPINVYGEHKLEAEKLVKQSGLPYLIVRVAKVFGHEEREKNFIARLAKTIETTGTIKWNAFTDQFTTAINAMDIAKALHLLLKANKEGVYHLGYGEYMNAYDMTMKVVNHYKDVTAVIGKITKADFKQIANRPALGGLTNQKFLSEYPDFEFTTIEDYLTERTS